MFFRVMLLLVSCVCYDGIDSVVDVCGVGVGVIRCVVTYDGVRDVVVVCYVRAGYVFGVVVCVCGCAIALLCV